MRFESHTVILDYLETATIRSRRTSMPPTSNQKCSAIWLHYASGPVEIGQSITSPTFF